MSSAEASQETRPLSMQLPQLVRRPVKVSSSGHLPSRLFSQQQKAPEMEPRQRQAWWPGPDERAGSAS